MKRPGFLRDIPPRAWAGVIVTAIWQFLVYEATDQLLGNRYHYDLTLPLDGNVPFLPWTSVIYLGGFLFWLVFYLYCGSRDRERAYRFFSADFLAKAVCLIFFIVLPTTNVRPEVTGNSVWAFIMRAIHFFDQPYNLFPSIHCMMSWLCYLGVREEPSAPKGLKTGVLLGALAIFLSTLTTRQHVAVDVLGGVALAEICYRVCAAGAIPRAYGETIDRLTDAWAARTMQKNIGKGVRRREGETER